MLWEEVEMTCHLMEEEMRAHKELQKLTNNCRTQEAWQGKTTWPFL